MELQTNEPLQTNNTNLTESEDIEYWSESSGSGPASCCLSECECYNSDESEEESADYHDYRKRYQFRSSYDSMYLYDVKEHVYDLHTCIKKIYEGSNMQSGSFFTKLPSRALLKFMEKGRFNFLTLSREPGGICEYCGYDGTKYMFHMKMLKKEQTFDICRRCMIELQPILEKYNHNIREFKTVLKRNKRGWHGTPYHRHNDYLDHDRIKSIEDKARTMYMQNYKCTWGYESEDSESEDSEYEDSEIEESKAEDCKAEDCKAEDCKAEDCKAEESKAEEEEEEDYYELREEDIQLYRKSIDVGPQFTKDSKELPKSEITNALIYNIIMNCPKLVLSKKTCVNCDICKQATKLYIVIHTTEKNKKSKIETEWDICVKCVYRFDYLIASYLVEKWDMAKEGKVSEKEKLIAMRGELLAPRFSSKV